MEFLAAAGRRLEYRWIAPRRAGPPPLVFLHEALGCAGLWRDFPDRLAERTGAGALVYSRAGHGRSDPIPATPGVQHLIDEAVVVLPAVLATGGLERPLLVGHSDGATIALLHAAVLDDVRGLILEAAHVFVEDVTIAGVANARAAFTGGRLREKLSGWHDHVDPLFSRWADTWLDPAFRTWNIEPLLPDVRCPTLVIQGEPDAYGTLAQVEAIRRGVSGKVEALVLPGAGHAPHVERSDEVLDAMAAFVQRLPHAGPPHAEPA